MKNTEFSIKEYVIAILYRWKFILIAAVLLAVFLGGYGYVKRSAKMDEMLDVYDKEKTAYSQSVTSNRNTIKYYTSSRNEADLYNKNSILMKVDPYKKPVATIYLNIDVDSETLYLDISNQTTLGLIDLKETIIKKIKNQYLVLAQNAPLTKILAGAIPAEYQEIYLREIVSISGGEADTIVISSTGTDILEAKKIVEAIYHYLIEKQPIVAATGGEHTLSILDQSSIHDVDKSLAELQNNQRNIVSDFSNKITELLDEIKVLNEKGRPSNPKIAPYVVKQAILGFILGAVLGVILAVTRFVSILPVQLPEQIQNQMGIRYLGGVRRREKGPFTRMLASIRGSFLLEEEKNALSLIGANIIEVLGNNKKVLLTGLLAENVTSEFVQKLSLQPTMKDVEMLTASNVNQSAESVRKLSESDAVILVERLQTSRMVNVLREKERIKMANKEIIGYVLY